MRVTFRTWTAQKDNSTLIHHDSTSHPSSSAGNNRWSQHAELTELKSRIKLCPSVQVRVTVPEIAVSMDAQEFQILQDVAAHLAAEQVLLPWCLACAPHLSL